MIGTEIDIETAYPKLQERLRASMGADTKVKAPSEFFLRLCEAVLKQSEKAWTTGNPVEILRAYRDMGDVLSGQFS